MRRSALLGCAFALLLAAFPQAGQRPAPPVHPADQPVFRLSVSLAQLDAVVTDRQGRHVTTLGPDDFEVYQDGRPQRVVAVSYVEADEGWVDTSGLPPLPPEALRPQDARRVVAVVVDDLRMSFESIYRARRGIGEFLDRNFQSGDMGMILATSGGSGQLTYSRNALKAAASRLRFSLWNVQAASVLRPLDGSYDPTELLERTFAESAVASLAQAINAMRPLPGRKSLVLVSEGFSVFGFGFDNTYVRTLLQQLVDRSNRAGVVIYAVDPRGLVYTGLTAADGPSAAGGGHGLARMRGAALLESQDGLRYVAGETGGFAVINNNDIALGFRRIMADQRGYYLIGYEPEAGTVNAKSDIAFRKVKIKVKPKGLKVRTRAGFYARATE